MSQSDHQQETWEKLETWCAAAERERQQCPAKYWQTVKIRLIIEPLYIIGFFVWAFIDPHFGARLLMAAIPLFNFMEPLFWYVMSGILLHIIFDARMAGLEERYGGPIG